MCVCVSVSVGGGGRAGRERVSPQRRQSLPPGLLFSLAPLEGICRSTFAHRLTRSAVATAQQRLVMQGPCSSQAAVHGAWQLRRCQPADNGGWSHREACLPVRGKV
eukprot:360799-Chlamydomonas_euryale.AAC.1